MANEANIKAVITAEDRASSTLKGFGNSIDEIGSKVRLALEGAAIAAVGFGVASVKAFSESQDLISQTNAVLQSTGGIAGVTADQVTQLATAWQKQTKFSDEAVRGAENILLTFTKITADKFPQATEAVLNLSTAMHEDLQSAAVQVGKALQDPILGITALRRVGVNFNDAQKEVVKNLVETGHQAEAQALILKELQTEFGGSAVAAGSTFSGSLAKLKNTLNDVEEKIGGTIVTSLTPFIQKAAEAAEKIDWDKVITKTMIALQAAGRVLVPIMVSIGSAVKGVFDWYTKLSPAMQKVVVTALLMTTVIKPITGIITGLLAPIRLLTSGLGALAAVGEGGGLLAALTGPVGIGVLAAGAIGFLGYKLYQTISATKDFVDQQEKANEVIGKGEYQVRLLTLATDRQREAEANLVKRESELQDLLVKQPALHSAVASARDVVTQAQKELNDATLKYGPASDEAAAATRRLEDANQLLNGKLIDSASNTLGVVVANQKLKDSINEVRDAQDSLIQLTNGLKDNTFPGLVVSLQSVSVQAGRTAQDIVGAFAPVADQVVSFQGKLGTLQSTSSTITSQILQNFGTLQSQADQTVKNLNQMPNNTALKVVPRATGGPVEAGSPYIIGERGPELFVPTRNGEILSNQDLKNVNTLPSASPRSGNSTINININAGALMGNDVEARKFAQIIQKHLQDAQNMKGMAVA